MLDDRSVLKVSASHLPVSFAILWGDVSLDEVAAMEQFYESLYARGQRFGAVVDARRARVPASPVRRAMADMSNRMEPRSKKLSIGTSTVLDSKILVAALQAVRWFIRAEVSLVYHSAARDSVEWMGTLLAAENLTLPSSARTLAGQLDEARDGEAAGSLFA